MVNSIKGFAGDFNGTLFINNEIKEMDIKAIKQLQNNTLFGISSGRLFSGLLS